MLRPEAKINWGEWLPDLPYYENPGLVEARNVIPVNGSYKQFFAPEAVGDALSARCQGAFAAADTAGDPEIYAGTATGLFERNGTSWTDRSGAAYTTAPIGYWRFVQFGEGVIATNHSDLPQFKTAGAAANFADLATSGTAPRARQIGIINNFVVLGDLSDATYGVVPYAVQWSAIGNARDWPIPLTSDARSKQSGRQTLSVQYGTVTAIANGQFYGLVFQQRGITRFTYIGGDTVFQVQEFERTRGCWFPQSMIQIGELCYFIAADGFYVTDGQSVRPIGHGKVDLTFLASCDQSYRERVTVSFDYATKCIHWCFPTATATSGQPNRLYLYNLSDNRFSYAESETQLLFQSFTTGYTLDQLDTLYTSIDDITVSLDSSIWQGGVPVVNGFTGDALAQFSGDALDARLETGEFEPNPMGYAFIRGVKPLVTGSPTTVQVTLGTRSSQDNENRSFGTPVTRTTRTGVCDFRTQARYLTARVDITGGFDRAIGIQVDLEEGDQV